MKFCSINEEMYHIVKVIKKKSPNSSTSKCSRCHQTCFLPKKSKFYSVMAGEGDYTVKNYVKEFPNRNLSLSSLNECHSNQQCQS